MTPSPTPADDGADPEADHDVIVIGSGFGGSVAALRLAEKGYGVHVIEAGRRFEDDDFAKTSWDVKNYLWAPRLGCFGVQRIHKLPDVLILAGAGVGGGSLNYANTLYVPGESFFTDRQWGDITDWQDELAPHYAMAQTMLGVVTNTLDGPVERVMELTARDLGVGDTFRHTPVGVFFGEPDVEVADPFFGGVGPARRGCTLCGNCMVGCRYGAKNTLVKNYLALAENLGVTIEPMRTVIRLGPVPGAVGADGEPTAYRVLTERTGSSRRNRDLHVLTARHVVVAAGTWGTQKLLHAMKGEGELPRLSDMLGHLTRTNSEALLGATTVTVPKEDLASGIAITTSFHPSEDTHIENCRYGPGSNVMGLLATIPVPGNTGRPRFLQFLIEAVKNPLAFLRSQSLSRWSERTVIGLVMQTRDNSLTVSGRRRRDGSWTLTSTQGHGEPNPTHLPIGHQAMAVLARRLGAETGLKAYSGGSLGEIADVPMTAHFLGGAPISDSPERGVVDPYLRAWGHPGISIVDGSVVSANLGVNPALTITAQAERAMSLWPNRGGADPRPAQGAAYERLDPVAADHPAVKRYPHSSARV